MHFHSGPPMHLLSGTDTQRLLVRGKLLQRLPFYARGATATGQLD
jgi:hypothetical protein